MAHTFEELKGMTVAALRDLAAETEHEAVQGYSQLRKDELILALCTALGIETHEHHEVIGINKKKVKAKIREAKKARDEALAARDKVALKASRRTIHRLKHKLRKATV